MSFRIIRAVVAGCALALAFEAFAADLPPDVLVRSRWMDLTRQDYEAALAGIPENMRDEFATSPKRVQGVLNNLVLNKTLAAQAIAHGTQASSEFAASEGTDRERALAAAELRRIDAEASADFDRKIDAFVAKAREIYALERDKYRIPETIRLSDIAVAIKDRGDEAALARAREARARLVAGADFATVAREYSDDPTTRDKGGVLPFVSAKDLVPPYAKGAFALTRIGEISEPIKEPAAYHVVRLEERRPSRPQTFDEAREAILQTLRQRYVAEQRDLRIRAINSDPDLQVNQPAIEALVKPVDPQAFTPSTSESPAVPPSAPVAAPR